MGYWGKVEEQAEARRLRGDGWTLLDIAEKLGVSKSSASLWVRDVEFEPRPSKSKARKRGPHPAHVRKLAEIDEMDGLDLAAAVAFWSEVSGIAPSQFGTPYRAVPDVGIRHNKHAYGCATIVYSCSRTHRAVMGLVRALLSSHEHLPG